MKILYEDSMLYADAFFPKLGEAKAFSHQSITPEHLIDVDVLLVRSTTPVTPALLSKANCLQFVGTATAGANHVDVSFLEQQRIPFSTAAGCNAIAVAEYVISAIYATRKKFATPVRERTVGIVGAGHVGTALASKLDALGVNYVLCDPPLAAKGDKREFVSFKQAMACDIISLHTPLVTQGPHPTHHMVNEAVLESLRDDQLLINACRGEVLDNQAALSRLEQGHPLNLVLDVWENEPTILTSLIPHCLIATAHIAGHTLEGKARGTSMLYQQLCQQFSLPETVTLEALLPEANPSCLTLADVLDNHLSDNSVAQLVHQIYNVEQDHQAFTAHAMDAERFRYIRKHYAMRREFSAVSLNAGNFSESEALYKLGFSR
ncbi:4-phosphoerythronate dehydrogenase [Aestuariibacter sp. AA17]|uniref:Erythronate-4-phosphate dehydrogenase n=1 Tax=Fluctibacter corallii TaxID=2984329 RepID=A0ABT3A390_9ALTE|nr:4-phosphoerythronate dehydrogenase [Aestuariibacter sp. AA17]MCV2883078.1 4-phosphoerythronate dehydrogenase [Aestuariibacter sp. AA17]